MKIEKINVKELMKVYGGTNTTPHSCTTLTCTVGGYKCITEALKNDTTKRKKGKPQTDSLTVIPKIQTDSTSTIKIICIKAQEKNITCRTKV